MHTAVCRIFLVAFSRIFAHFEFSGSRLACALRSDCMNPPPIRRRTRSRRWSAKSARFGGISAKFEVLAPQKVQTWTFQTLYRLNEADFACAFFASFDVPRRGFARGTRWWSRNAEIRTGTFSNRRFGGRLCPSKTTNQLFKMSYLRQSHANFCRKTCPCMGQVLLKSDCKSITFGTH